MRLVIATPLYPPEIGGPATYAQALEAGLPARGVSVELVKFSEVRHLPKLVRHVTYFFRVRRALKRADAVLALDPVSVGLPACLAAWSLGKPLVVKIVGDYAWEQGRQRYGVTEGLDEFVRSPQPSFAVRMLQGVEMRVARAATRIIVPSKYLKEVVWHWGRTYGHPGVSEGKIEVIYNAVSVDDVGSVPEVVAKLPRPLVAAVGRLVPWKHVDGVIDAVTETAAASLAVVGDGPLRTALARRAEESLPGRYAFTGELSHADTLAVIQSADVLVLNSSYEGFSHLIVEALSLGAVVIATRVGGNPEAIVGGENGALIPSGDENALRVALVSLLADTEARARLSARAKESAKRFSLHVMLDATAAFLFHLPNAHPIHVGHNMSDMK